MERKILGGGGVDKVGVSYFLPRYCKSFFGGRSKIQGMHICSFLFRFKWGNFSEFHRVKHTISVELWSISVLIQPTTNQAYIIEVLHIKRSPGAGVLRCTVLIGKDGVGQYSLRKHEECAHPAKEHSSFTNNCDYKYDRCG